jgi:plastocyanin
LYNSPMNIRRPRFRFAPRSIRGIVATIGLTASLVACGGGSDAPDATAPADAGLVVTAVPSIRFDATEYSATAGTIKVAYINNDTVRHTLLVVKDDTTIPNFKLDIGKKGAIDVGEVNLAAGVYTLICDVPGHQNMKANLTVS